MISSSRILWSLCTTGVVLGVFLVPNTGRGQVVKDEKEGGIAHLQVYMLEYASVDAMSDVLTTMMADMDLKISVDSRSNRLIVFANTAVHKSIASLIQSLDVRDTGRKLSVVKSKDKALAISGILKQLDLEVDVAVDPNLGVIMLRGTKEAVGHAQDLIVNLEQLVPLGTADWSERQYSVELFTVTSGEADDPAALHDLEAEGLGSFIAVLRKKGIDHPILLAKSEITTLAQSRFSVSDAAFAHILGTVEPASNGVRLEIEMKMATEDRPVSFQTTILTKLDHPIAFASTQPRLAGAMTYVLVVRVREK